jgi:hypothetical protein
MNEDLQVASDESNDHEAVLADRYELGDKIGQGGQGITRLATDRETGESVVVKELRIEHLDDWKSVELFEREGDALQSLDHPAIPAYVDHFHLDSDESSRLFLVQEYVEGVDLARAIDDGLRLTEDEAVDLIAELLEILDHIHALNPPVIHRDIKPANIMRRADGSLALVDFGAARTVLEGASGGSTVVGTTGYMPLEQLMGRALPATDLYAVGATAIHLLSHKHPADIDVLEMKLQFREDISVSQGLGDFLDKLVEPHVEDRYQTAGEALGALRQIGQVGQVGQVGQLGQGGQVGPSGERGLARTSSAQQGLEQRGPKKKGPAAPLAHAPEQGGAEVGGMLGKAFAGMAKTAQERAQRKLAWAQGFFDGQSFERPLGSFWSDIERDGARVLHREPKGVGGAAKAFVGVAVLYGIVASFVVVMIFGDEWGFKSSGSETFGWVMMAVFALVGLFVVYHAALQAWGIEEFELTDDAITHRQKVFNHEKTTVIPLDDVEDIDMTWDTSTSSSNNGRSRTVTHYYFLIVTTVDEHRFGKEMTKNEKLWAASALRDHVDEFKS